MLKLQPELMDKKYKVNWDLSFLFKSDKDPDIEKRRKEVISKTKKFVRNWKKREDYLKDPKVLKQALDEYENWARYYGHNYQEKYYFELRHALNQEDPTIKAKLNLAEELSQDIQNQIQFFELSIAKISPRLQKKFLSYKPINPYKHFLERLFRQSKHLLSEPEEKILNLKTLPSHTNWIRMTSSFLSKEQRKITDESGKKSIKNFSELLGIINSQKKEVRDSAAKAFNDILEKYVEVAEHELNSILLDKKINDRLRGFKRPDSARHISDDIDTEVVDCMIETVSRNFDIPKRFYKLKAKLLGVKKLKYHERNVEYGKIDKKYSYQSAVEILKKVFRNLDDDFLEIFSRFVNEGRIDVFPKKGKVSGAFCTYGLLINPTYTLLNWTEKLADVLTLAHESGHGIHFELSKMHQNALNFGTSIATTEVASTFMEDFVFKELKETLNENLKLSLMMMKLNEDINTIFRQIAFYNFERELHEKFRMTGYLSKEEIGKIFQKHMASYMGRFVEQSPGSQNWWVYVSHFRDFFYVYSYASGLLISKSLQSSVKSDPKFINKVKEFLSTGLSDSPKNIFSNLGVDITDRKFWERGINEVDTLLKDTEILAKKLGKI